MSEVLARLSPATVGIAAQLWGIDEASLKRVNQGINVVYRGRARGRIIYLRLTHTGLRNQEYLNLPIDFLSHAIASGAQVCAPLLSANNRFIEELPQGQDLFLATVVSGVPGQAINPPEANAYLMHEWGYSLGLLHSAAETYTHKAQTLSHHWEKQWQDIRPYLESDPEILAEYETITEWTKTLPKVDFGLCHSDFRAANCLWDGEKVWIIDFDEPTYCWFPYDMARALMEFSDLKLDKRWQAMEWFLEGYSAAKPFDPELVLGMGWFVRLRTLLMYAWGFEDGASTLRLASGMGSGNYRERILHPISW